MPPAHRALRALLPFALHAVARELDAALGVLLHTSLDVPGLAGLAPRLLAPGPLAGSIALWTAGGGAAWLLAAAWRRHACGLSLTTALDREASLFDPLLLRPALTLLALASVALQPTFPHAATLPVALTQDLAPFQDLAALGALLALRPWPRRISAPGAPALFLIALLGYGLSVPDWGRRVEGHPGNEPKYLRMGVALGHALELDVEGRDEPMEELTPPPLGDVTARALGHLARESLALVGFVARDPLGVMRLDAIEASRLARQTIAGKRGGVYHVLAPGPSLLLALPLRVDRTLNRRLGTPGRLRTSLLAWNALAAALVVALYLLLRDVTGRAGLAALLAAAAGVTPPFLFYGFQFYPEMPGALILALAIRTLFVHSRPRPGAWLGVGLLIATLPWWHQKFLPVWGVLVIWGVLRGVHQLVRLRTLAAFLAPQLVSVFLTALYNFAITGSPRPDALFRAWGPGGISTETLGQGFFGLALDIHYGLLPWAPVYLLGLGGLAATGPVASRLRWAIAPVGVYYLTVAAADDWHGAVSNLGRYAMPALPWLIALGGLAIARLAGRRGVVTVVFALVAWSGLAAAGLWNDPHAANDASLLADSSAIADARVYLPDLFIPSFARAAPALPAQLATWAALVAALGLWLFREQRSRAAGASPLAALAVLFAVLMVAGGVLERWPSPHRLPRFPDALELRPGTVAFATRGGTAEGAEAWRVEGDLELLVRSRRPLERLLARAVGDGVVRGENGPPIGLEPRGRWIELPLVEIRHLKGRRGVEETLYRAALRRVEGGSWVLIPGLPPETGA